MNECSEEKQFYWTRRAKDRRVSTVRGPDCSAFCSVLGVYPKVNRTMPNAKGSLYSELESSASRTVSFNACKTRLA